MFPDDFLGFPMDPHRRRRPFDVRFWYPGKCGYWATDSAVHAVTVG